MMMYNQHYGNIAPKHSYSHWSEHSTQVEEYSKIIEVMCCLWNGDLASIELKNDPFYPKYCMV